MSVMKERMKVELGVQCARLESGLINFAAMGNNMNRYGVLNGIGCVDHTPVTDPELEQNRKGACQRLWMHVIVTRVTRVRRNRLCGFRRMEPEIYC